MKKKKLLIIFAMTMSLLCVACREELTVTSNTGTKNTIISSESDTIDGITTSNSLDTETSIESNVAENTYPKGSPEYVFEQFLNGEIDAEPLPSLERKESVNIIDLNIDPDVWTQDAYYVGEQLDLDNDGENELILDGIYGGMYLDAVDGSLYIFAEAQGNAGALSYVFYDNAFWIVYSDVTHSGRLNYTLYQYNGGDNVVDSMSLFAEKTSEEDLGTYTFKDEVITEEEFFNISDEIFNNNEGTDTETISSEQTEVLSNIEDLSYTYDGFDDFDDYIENYFDNSV